MQEHNAMADESGFIVELNKFADLVSRYGTDYPILFLTISNIMADQNVCLA